MHGVQVFKFGTNPFEVPWKWLYADFSFLVESKLNTLSEQNEIDLTFHLYGTALRSVAYSSVERGARRWCSRLILWIFFQRKKRKSSKSSKHSNFAVSVSDHIDDFQESFCAIISKIPPKVIPFDVFLDYFGGIRSILSEFYLQSSCQSGTTEVNLWTVFSCFFRRCVMFTRIWNLVELANWMCF